MNTLTKWLEEHKTDHELMTSLGEVSAVEALLKNVYDGVVICDQHGVILDANNRLLDFVQYTLPELVNRNVLDLLSGAESNLIGTIDRALAGNRYVLVQAYGRRKDGQIFPVEISVNHLKLNQTLLCFFIRDITVRKRSEDLLRTGYNAISNCLSGIAVADPMGIIVYVNPATLKIWGCLDERELKGQSILNLWADPARARHMVDAIMDQSMEWRGDLVARRMDGRQVALHISAACNMDNEDEATGMVFSFVDISDRLRADAAVREAETREAMLASLAAACHHLGQPATVILTSLGLLKEQCKSDNEETTMLFQVAHEAALKLADLLRKLSATSEYRTTDYLISTDRNSPFNKMLDIE